MEFAEVVGRVVVGGDDALVARLRVLEGRRREVEAETAVLLAELERRKTYRSDAHASMWGLLRSTVGWSDRECRERMRLAHLIERFADAGEALFDAQVSVANLVEVARAGANPRCGDGIDVVVGTLLNAAARLEFDDLKVVVRTWERTADADGAHRDAEASHVNRNAHVVVWDGVGHAAAQWGELDGLANREIFDQYVAAEWRTDWDATVERHGDAACTELMPRSDAQRRADAMTRIFADAAATAPGAKPPEPVVNIHLDHATFTDLMVEAELFPEHVTDPFERPEPLVTDRRCATDNGDPVDPHTVLRLMLEHHVRFVTADAAGIPTVWGDRQRLFTGKARQAVMSLSPRCTHPGCRVRARRSHADHTTEHARGGPTVPANGGPRCPRHNLIKNHGSTVHRDTHGHWHTYRPDGTEIC
jgi:hypothetical protein